MHPSHLPFSISQTIKYAFNTTSQYLGYSLLLFFVHALAYFLAGLPIFPIISPFLFLFFAVTPLVTVSLLLIISLLVYIISYYTLILGINKMTLDIHDTGKSSLRHLVNLWPWAPQQFIAALCYILIVSLGMVMFVIPGLIFMVRFGFYGYLIADRRIGALKALSYSWQITQGSTIKLLLLWLILVVINFLGALVLGFGLVITIPMTFFANTYVYRLLAAQVPVVVEGTVHGNV